MSGENGLRHDLIEELRRLRGRVSELENRLKGQATSVDFIPSLFEPGVPGQAVFDLAEQLPDAVFAVDSRGRVTAWNRAMERLTGVPRRDMLGKGGQVYARPFYGEPGPMLVDLLAGGAQAPVRTYRHLARDEDRITAEVFAPSLFGGRGAYLWASAAPLRDRNGAVVGGLESIRDCSLREQSVADLRGLIHRDPLTRLPDRSAFTERLEQELSRQRLEPDRRFAVLFMDLDRFKHVNDALGHAAGDRLLIQVAERVSGALRGGDLLARFGGDEFVALLGDLGDFNSVMAVVNRIQRALIPFFELEGRRINASASIGVALCEPGSYDGPEAIVRDADEAMYGAKREGRAGCKVFTAALGSLVQRGRELEDGLREALEKGDFELRCLPLVRISERRLAAYEAMLRRASGAREYFFADRLRGVEDASLLAALEDWLLTAACDLLAALGRGREPVGMGVAVSRRSVLDGDLLGRLSGILAKSGADPGRLTLCLDASAASERIAELVGPLGRLKTLGVGLCLDDFGEGVVSPHGLEKLPLDLVRIGRTVTRELAEDAARAKAAEAVIAVAGLSGTPVAAKGVDSLRQIFHLVQAGCDLAQGDYFSRPLSRRAALAGEMKAPAW